MVVEPASVGESVRAFTLSILNISETIVRFYMKQHWGRGLPAIGFKADWIRTLVSMATDSSH